MLCSVLQRQPRHWSTPIRGLSHRQQRQSLARRDPFIKAGDPFTVTINVYPEQASIRDASSPVVRFSLTIGGFIFSSASFEWSGYYTETDTGWRAGSTEEAWGSYSSPYMVANCSIWETGGSISLGYTSSPWEQAIGGFTVSFENSVPDNGATFNLLFASVGLIGITGFVVQRRPLIHS